MSIIRRLSLVSGALFIIAAGLFCSTVPADAYAASSVPPQKEMLYLSASRLAEEENLTAILWVQRSAEFRALSYQAYNLAVREVEKAVAQRREKEITLRKTKEKNSELCNRLLPLAVVLDIDDTIACHAPLEAYYTEHPEAKADYNAWDQWISKHKLLLPGAADFLKYADRKGVQVFYVTGRGPRDKKVTEGFLQKAGLPFPDGFHLLMNDGSGGKMNHFAKLARRYDTICYLGDNIADFPIGAVRDENTVIYKKDTGDNNSGNLATANGAGREKNMPIGAESVTVNTPETEMQSGKRKTKMPLDIQAMLKQDKNAVRNRIVDAHKNAFGTAFILLPNPMYGDWEYNLARKFRRLPAEQRIALRKAALKSFEFIK